MWVTDTLRACGIWTLVILLLSAVVGLVVLVLVDDPSSEATTAVGLAADSDGNIGDEMSGVIIDTQAGNAIIDHVAEDSFGDEIDQALEISGINTNAEVSASAEPLATEIKIVGRADNPDVADQASILAADAVVAWFNLEDGPREVELTVLSVERASTPEESWLAALVIALGFGAFSMVLLVARRKPARRLRFSRDLAPAHRGVPVIGGAETEPSDLLSNTTAVLSRIGRRDPTNTTVIAVVGIDKPASADLINLLERRLAAANSTVRLQTVRGISANVRRFSAVLVTGPTMIGADRVSEELDVIASHSVRVAAVVLGDIDAMERQRGARLSTEQTKDKTPNVEVIITHPSD
jgi:hypothetical protein